MPANRAGRFLGILVRTLQDGCAGSEKIAADYEGKVKVVKVNVDENADIASRYGIMSIPTMMLLKTGSGGNHSWFQKQGGTEQHS